MQDPVALGRLIDAVQDLKLLVRALKALSAASIRQYENAAQALVEYYHSVELGLRVVLGEAVAGAPPLVPPGPAALVVLGSDHGLCGRFNADAAAAARARAAELDTPVVYAMGARLQLQLQSIGLPAAHSLALPGSVVGITGAVQRVLLALDAQREAGGLARVDLVYNARQSGANAVRVQVVLPLDPAVLQAAAGRAWPTRVLPAYRMPRSALFSALVREYLFVSLFRACAQSLAGEHASRLAAMQLAERHVDARLDELREAHRQARQEAITSELLDVVAGFEVLAGPGSL